MLSFLLFVIAVLVVGGLLFLGGSLLLGRGETQPPADPDRSPVELPDGRPLAGDDVRALQISAAFRGYRMTEVDWLLDQFAQAFDERDAQIASLQRRLAERSEPAASPAAPPDSESPADRPGDDGARSDA